MQLNKRKIRPVAFVLPQFHPIPENNKWWGEGFTEWTNVTKAQPLFRGHYQPRLPADLGFYDLRLPEAREAQARLAKEYGIYGFCYYHYWFNGKRLLNRPIDDILQLKEPDMPFMLCWANENWTRRWDGHDQDVLMKQEYSHEDDQTHIRWLCEKVFSDARYITVNGCPVFAVYRANLFPNLKKTSEIWRKIAREEYGFKDLYLCVMESCYEVVDPNEINFDAVVEFSPHQVIKHRIPPSKIEKLLVNLNLAKQKKYSLRDYKRAVEESLERKECEFKVYRSVTPGFDNTARKKEHGVIALGGGPTEYYQWLYKIVNSFQPFSEEENFIFINAMNEWAEGNHLEPCTKYGTEFLKATHNALKGC